MTEKELEILFRKKFNEREVEFNPAAWEGAEALIVAGEQRKRRRAVVAWSAAATVATVIGLSVWGAFSAPQYQPVNGQMIAWPSEDVNDGYEAMDVESIANTDVQSNSSSDLAADNSDHTSSEVSEASEVNANVTVETNSLASTANTTAFAAADEAQREELLTVELASLGIAHVEDESLSATPTNLPAIDLLDMEDEATTVVASTETTEDDSPIISRPRHRVQAWSVGAELGATGSMLTGGDLGWKPAYYLGIPVEFSFAENLTLNSGLFYSQRTSYGIMEQEEMIQYGFGSTSVRRDFTSLATGYLEVPMTIAYNFNNHELALGGYLGYEVLEYGTTKVVEETSLSPARVDSYLSRRENPEGKNLDYGLKFGYAYRVDDRWRVTAQGLYGLGDGYGDESSGINRHVQLRLGVRYMIGL